MIKDYYNILQVAPSATSDEIKTAFRKMAQRYHPDKNNDNKYAIAHFNIIKEAYENLTDPVLKEKYLQQRWLLKSKGLFFEEPKETPDQILRHFINVNSHISKMDEYRIDKKGLEEELYGMLDTETIAILNNFDDQGIINEIIKITIANVSILSPKSQVSFIHTLKKLNAGEKQKRFLNVKEKQLNRLVLWNKYRLFTIFLAVIILCTIIAFSS